MNFKGGEYIDNYYYGQLWIKFVSLSLLGTASILFICKLFPKFMSFAGEHSLLLLMVHPYILDLVRLTNMDSVFSFIITLVISLLLILILSRYLPILEGKKMVIRLKR